MELNNQCFSVCLKLLFQSLNETRVGRSTRSANNEARGYPVLGSSNFVLDVGFVMGSANLLFNR